MKKRRVINIFFLIMYCIAPLPLQSAGPQGAQSDISFDELFKDVDFEQLAKEMDQLFKEIEAEEKIKQAKTQQSPAAQQSESRQESEQKPTAATSRSAAKRSNKKPEDLFCKPDTEQAPDDKKKNVLWITQETLDATDRVLDNFTAALDTLSNKSIESGIVTLDELSLHMNNLDIIKVACSIMKSKMTYKRILLTPQGINKNLEKPMEQLRKDIIQATKKATDLAKKIKVLSAEQRQQSDIDKLQAFTKKPTPPEKPAKKKTKKPHKPKQKSFADVIGESDMTEIND